MQKLVLGFGTDLKFKFLSFFVSWLSSPTGQWEKLQNYTGLLTKKLTNPHICYLGLRGFNRWLQWFVFTTRGITIAAITRVGDIRHCSHRSLFCTGWFIDRCFIGSFYRRLLFCDSFCCFRDSPLQFRHLCFDQPTLFVPRNSILYALR